MHTHSTIFLGETFSSYVSVHNDSKETATDVVLKVSSLMHTRTPCLRATRSPTPHTCQAELQTGTQRTALSKSEKGSVAQLLPDASVDDIVRHEVKELGIHM